MLRRLRETAPVGLVPLAWTFAAAAHLGVLGRRTVLIGHVVMAVLLFAFAALSWDDMVEDAALRAWLAVIVAGLGVTLVGVYALATAPSPTLVTSTVVGWMALPSAALVYTGRLLPAGEGRSAYVAAGALSGLGTLVFLYATLAGEEVVLPAIALVGIGQTAGILDAALRF